MELKKPVTTLNLLKRFLFTQEIIRKENLINLHLNIINIFLDVNKKH